MFRFVYFTFLFFVWFLSSSLIAYISAYFLNSTLWGYFALSLREFIQALSSSLGSSMLFLHIFSKYFGPGLTLGGILFSGRNISRFYDKNDKEMNFKMASSLMLFIGFFLSLLYQFKYFVEVSPDISWVFIIGFTSFFAAENYCQKGFVRSLSIEAWIYVKQVGPKTLKNLRKFFIYSPYFLIFLAVFHYLMKELF